MVVLVPKAESPYGSLPALKILYKKLQAFASDHNAKYKDVPNAQFSASDIANMLLIEFLLNVTPDDAEVQSIKRNSKSVEEAIDLAVKSALSRAEEKGFRNTS